MERHLVSKGAYDAFKTAFADKNGSTWDAERDAVDFLRDDVVHALAKALKQSEESAAAWFDNARETYRINIEGLAKLIQSYLATKPTGHRIVFLVDEVGQFIGDNTQLMLTCRPSPSSWARFARAGHGSSSPVRKTSTRPLVRPTKPNRRTSQRFRGASIPVCRWPVPIPTKLSANACWPRPKLATSPCAIASKRRATSSTTSSPSSATL
jgi:hypothetical protein